MARFDLILVSLVVQRTLLSIRQIQEQWFELQLNAVSFRRLKQLQIDAFTDRPFAGNPAAVVVLPPVISKIGVRYDEHWMQQLAMENNLAETAFITPLPSACNEYSIRWFVVSTEALIFEFHVITR